MRVVGLILMLQFGVMLFAWYQAYKSKKEFWKCLDIRAFWGIAVLFNLGGIFLTIYDYKCASSGQYDFVADEMGMEICFFVVQIVLSLIDILTIYLMTMKHWKVQRMFRVLVYASVLVLLITFQILVSSQYVRSFVVLFMEVNIVPLLISVCADLGKIER